MSVGFPILLAIIATPAIGAVITLLVPARRPEIDKAAFSLPVGSVSDAIATAQGAAIIKVASRPEIAPADYATAKEKFRAEVLNERRMRFYQTYMQKARGKMTIDVNDEALRRTLGS